MHYGNFGRNLLFIYIFICIIHHYMYTQSNVSRLLYQSCPTSTTSTTTKALAYAILPYGLLVFSAWSRVFCVVCLVSVSQSIGVRKVKTRIA